MTDTEAEKQYWTDAVIELKRLVEKELIKSSDIGVYYSNLITVQTYKLQIITA